MNTIFKFFDPGFTSFIKNKASFAGAAIVRIIDCLFRSRHLNSISAVCPYFGIRSYNVSFSLANNLAC